MKYSFLFIACLFSLFANAQTTKPVTNAAGRPVYNFTAINPKLSYVFIEDKATKGHPQEGDDVMMRMIALCNNRIMYNSSSANKGKPGAFSIAKAAFKGDIADALMLMTPGDSVICMVDAQSMYDYTKAKMPDYIKPGDKIQYNIRLVSIKPREELQKEREAAFNKQMEELNAEANKLVSAEDKLLQDYFKAKNISPVKTKSGMYYSIQKKGAGALAAPGDTVTMNYRGTFLDGTTFDSNLDSAFMHVQPLTFVLGTGSVIKGWDEGICYLNPGSKAYFYIPSSLAYGAQSLPANPGNPKGIPANSILVFDVELMSAKHMNVAIH